MYNAGMSQPALIPDRRYTVAEYFEIDQASPDHRYEYWDGQLLDMAGGSESHGLIAANVLTSLNQRLADQPCRVYGSDVRVQVHRTTRYVYPDASVVCGPREFNPDAPKNSTITNPRLIVEVLSPSTESHDRSDKFADYIRCPVLEEYVMVVQDKPRIECYHRQGDGSWSFTWFEGIDATARLRSLQIEMPLREAYAKVEFPPPPPERAAEEIAPG